MRESSQMALTNPNGVPVQIHGPTATVVPFTSLEKVAPLLASRDEGMLMRMTER